MIFDIVVLSILVISSVIAFLRGFIREVLTILGVVGGLVAAWFVGPALTPMTDRLLKVDDAAEESRKFFDLVPHSMVADTIAYGGIFVVVVIILSVVSHILSGSARAVGLGALDRSLGVVFGIARGVLILGILYLPVYMLIDHESRAEWTFLQSSRTHFYVEGTASFMSDMIPESWSEDAKKELDEATESVTRATREKLQEIDILNSDEEESAQDEVNGDNAGPVSDGYEEGDRKDMKELIQDNINDQ